MISPEEIESRLTDLQAQMAQVQEIVSRHGPEHRNQGLDPIPGYHQVKTTSGAPTHQAGEGTICYVAADNQGYFNNDGSTGWTLIETGGAGADKAAQYLVLALSGDLTAERRFVPGTGISGVDGGADGDYTVNVDNDHAEAHAPESHTGTDITAAELEDLSDNGATTIHKHDHGGQDGLGDEDHSAYIANSLLTTRGDLIRRGAAAPERVALGTAGQRFVSDATDAVWATDYVAFAVPITNADSADSGEPRILLPCPLAGEITKVEVKLNENETCGATSLIVDVHKILAANLATDQDGTTMYTTQANRPTVTNTNYYVNATLPDVVAFAQGDWLAFFIDQAGTNVTTCTIGVRAKKT